MAIATEQARRYDGKVGVVHFSNTSLCEEGRGHYHAIFADLWAHAMALTDVKRQGNSQ